MCSSCAGTLVSEEEPDQERSDPAEEDSDDDAFVRAPAAILAELIAHEDREDENDADLEEADHREE
jgi:hypothetical protein